MANELAGLLEPVAPTAATCPCCGQPVGKSRINSAIVPRGPQEVTDQRLPLTTTIGIRG